MLFRRRLGCVRDCLYVRGGQLRSHLAIRVRVSRRTGLYFIPGLVLRPVIRGTVLRKVRGGGRVNEVRVRTVIERKALRVHMASSKVNVRPSHLVEFERDVVSSRVDKGCVKVQGMRHEVRLRFKRTCKLGVSDR